jgi:hypothetical protein
MWHFYANENVTSEAMIQLIVRRPTISGTYTVNSGGGSINYGSGFTTTGLTFNGF